MSGVLVHEWIAQAGGSENVVEALTRLYPDAELVCLWNDSVGRFDETRLRESWLARTPLRRSKAAALPLMPLTWRTMRDRDYDWALISSHAFAHHVRFRGADPQLRRMVYVHTPARYVWTPDLDARGSGRTARLVSRALRPVDRRRAREGAEFAANSEYVAERIRTVWGVEPRVVFPPVEVEQIQSVADWAGTLGDAEGSALASLPEGFVLGASRFIPYKRLDHAITVGEVTGRPVVLAGGGPSRPELEERARTARVPVTFVDSPSTSMLYALYAAAALYVFPPVEDFGIMPVEAMAAGAPVLARDVGGAAESTVQGLTGALSAFEDATEIRESAEVALATSREDRLTHAKRFGVGRFGAEIREWVGE